MAQSKRTVRIYKSSTGGLTTHESDAVFFGQLKNELHLDPEKETITVQETKTTLYHDEAQLPEGNFLIFVSQKKSKSGMGNIATHDGKSIEKIEGKDLESRTYNELRSYCTKLLGKSPSKKDEIIQALVDSYSKNTKSSPVKQAEKKEKVETVVEKAVFEKKESEGTVYPKNLEDRLVRIERGLFEIAKGLNFFIEVEEGIPIDISVFDRDVQSLPVEVKNKVNLTEEERRKIFEEEELKRIQREAKSLGL